MMIYLVTFYHLISFSYKISLLKHMKRKKKK